MKLWADKEVETAEDIMKQWPSMSDALFVQDVRIRERLHPWLRILNCWMEGVRRELDMRLLLK